MSKPASDRKKAVRPVDGYELLELAKAQQADGGFEWSDALIAGTSISKGDVAKTQLELIDATSAPKEGVEKIKRIILTLLALRAFEHQFAARKDEWRMMADKAQRWLAKQNVPVPSGFTDWKAWSARVFK